MDIRVGDEVYWNDPDNDIGSGYFTVIEILGNGILRLKNSHGSELEVFEHELS